MLFIQRKVDKSKEMLGLPKGTLLTKEVVKKAFVEAAKRAHPDSGAYNSEDYFKPTLDKLQKARDTLLQFLEMLDG